MKSLWRYTLVILVSVKFVSTQCIDGTCDCHCTCCAICGYTRDNYCELCEAGWGGSINNRCQRKNLAYKATATSSSTTGNNFAMNAVDEDPGTYALTKTEKYPWLTITLSTIFTIKGIYLISNEDRYTTFSVYITNSTLTELTDVTLCNIFYATNYKNPRNVICTKTLTGDQFVITTNSTLGRLMVYEIQVYECAQGTYGDLCDRECRNCVDNRCDGYTGVCERGCKVGWQGERCDIPCDLNCKDGKCNQDTGICTEGCKPDWYGNTCDKQCPSQCKTSCDPSVGCTNCPIGYNGPYCNPCDGNTYGKNCSLTCQNCDDCNIVNGCGVCWDGFYGDLCNLKCPKQCRNYICSRQSGDCVDGCKDGYGGTKCETACKDNCATCSTNDLCISCLNGRFGTNCEYLCSGTCGGSKTCDKNSGVCSECNPGTFGPNCTQQCSGNCLPGTLSVCDRNGICISGCVDGWFGPQCDTQCPIENCEKCNSSDFSCEICNIGYYLDNVQEIRKCVKCPSRYFSCNSDLRCTECIPKFTGYQCENECTINCVDDLFKCKY
ncbi:cell death abnormality protein 1-like [Crassostrea angulata]|uniref:cell death abnormality protein 1-like n=1 Tax=Magallana angulata TaxID=2784310 RepID=UPI0022B0CF55|nr:cell death abnormality protein 1-like [Crassostrea angulata]XP_052690154.1 cell death abnormality protein 1-like [Crassostrea angulata]XP_052690156.1 cell death abnormality protein 1-like [Crassostrea angulata]XP_052690157.1 cell death abnormality protein 1-like [Crassostrea angulata]XP_052690158.1 cell death abnormality protein 1-like [Crassostrea angulata]XP_052690159.1 cell death abnormality protein 1-like [Crassostrea angulata]XP_052690160.1 cell death abnormality protein 1-like [Crass